MTTMLGLWNAIVEIASVFAIVVIALSIMLGVSEPGRGFVRLGVVVACMILLVQLPAIILGIWYSLSFWQHIGILVLVFVAGLVLLNGVAGRRGKRSPHD